MAATALTSAVGIKDGANLDAFSRLRTAHPETLFNVQCQYGLEPLLLESVVSGTGVAAVHGANDRMVAISCTAGTGVSKLQSYEYVPYQPGKSQLILTTGLLGAGVAGAVVDFGYGDLSNGIFLRQNGASGLQIMRRTSTSGSIVDNTVEQASWNLDPMNGSGASGITLDVTKVFILVIDLQFLGMGRVRVGFDIGGNIIYCHEFRNANVIAVPYMQTASLPIMAMVSATSTGATKTSYFKCAAVISEGGFSRDFGYEFVQEGTATAGSGARTHMLSLRPKATFNSIANRLRFEISEIEMLVTGNSPILWELVIGQAISGTTTFNDVNGTYSAMEYNTAGTISESPALVIDSGYVASSATQKGSDSHELSHRYPITLDAAGAVRLLGTISLIVTGIGGAPACRGSIKFREIR